MGNRSIERQPMRKTKKVSHAQTLCLHYITFSALKLYLFHCSFCKCSKHFIRQLKMKQNLCRAYCRIVCLCACVWCACTFTLQSYLIIHVTFPCVIYCSPFVFVSLKYIWHHVIRETTGLKSDRKKAYSEG